MTNMYTGLLNVGINGLRSFSDWAFFLLILGAALGLGSVSGRVFGNPIEFVKSNRLVVFFILLIVFVAVGILVKSDELQEQPTAPYGIVSFELAKEQGKAKQIIDQWSMSNDDLVGLAVEKIKMDFLFILSYAALLGYICFWIAETNKNIFIASFGLTLGWAVPLAGILDVIENIALLRMLENGASQALAAIAFWCALPKFVITLYLPDLLIVAIVIVNGVPSLFPGLRMKS